MDVLSLVQLRHLSGSYNRQARELKSVQLDAPAGAVRLLVHAPHPNRFNTSGQVW